MAAPTNTLGMEKSDAMDEWTIVLPRRGKQKTKGSKYVLSKNEAPVHTWTPKDVDANPERERRLLHKMDICIQKLENSQFWKSLLNQMESTEFLNRIINLLGSESSMKMVVYGIGSIESYDPPRLQLGIVILMKRNFGWIGDVEVFDPIISLIESKVLDSLGCSVLSLNEQGRRQALRPTFFFMPHCEAELYENLLEANWRSDMLNRTILFGNSFDEYEQYMSLCNTSTISKPRKHILAIRNFTTEVRISADFDDYYRAFNGSSWHFFCLDSELDSLLQ
ncbi:hypothetical protein LIER_35991 [Lithospermum erythrorhizon]|uniref:SRR1-like domain-containing protein n=1 Tax=Lithospermum erythrorhizon TaxID=34254 RepID=A0AAV3NZ64_LITER